MHRRLLVAAAFATSLTWGAPVASAAPTTLERQVLQSVRAAGFGDVIDGEAPAAAQAPWHPPIAHTPQVDVAVLDLDTNNRVRDAANVLVSRDYPNGVLVPIDGDLSSSEVRYRKWDRARWDGTVGVGWGDPYGPGEDVVAGREGAALQFMEPYPASALKVMVAFGILRLVDQGKVALDSPLVYPGSTGTCYGGADTKTVRSWMTLMITESSNEATCALIRDLHQLGEMDALNAHFVDMGLASLSLRGTSPSDGGNWSGGRGVFMGGLDTTKLLWLVDGAPGTLWRAPDGRAVTAAELSDESRAFYKFLLSEQGFNEVLATTNWCGATLGSAFPDPGAPLTAPGIPTATPSRFIQPDGTVEVEGVPYGQPVAACNAAAEVVFSHKTGLVTNAGADVGFVHALPGKRRRNYVIAIFTNLGNRFGDPVFNTAASDPYNGDFCWSDKGLCYTKAFAKLGKSVDDTLKGRPQIAYAAVAAQAGTALSVTPSQAETAADVRWSVTPALPAGLALDPATGTLTGTPSGPSAEGEYLVTATDTSGAGDTSLRLGVRAATPAPWTAPTPAPASVPGPRPRATKPAVKVTGGSRSLSVLRSTGRLVVRLSTARPLALTATAAARVPTRALGRRGGGSSTIATTPRAATLKTGATAVSLSLSPSARRGIRRVKTVRFVVRLSLVGADGTTSVQRFGVLLR